MKTVVGLYEDIADAQDAINDLVRSGFDRGNISLIAADRWTEGGKMTPVDDDTLLTSDPMQLGSDVAAGMTTGSVVGGLGGVLLGLGALAIPGFGPIIAAGPLVAGLAGAGIGAAVGGLVGGLVNWGVPPEEAELYAESVRRGNILVGLKTDEATVSRATEIMNRYGPLDVQGRSEYWRSTGWAGYDNSSAAWTADQMRADQLDYSDYLDYSAFADSFRDHFQNTYGARGHEYVQYDPAYRYGYTLGRDARYLNATTWDEIEADVRADWEKTEFAAGRTWNDFKDAIRYGWEQVRDALDFDDGYGLFEPGFREHYQTQYGNLGHDFDAYSPAYRYGYNLAMDERWDEYETWEELEAEARAEWERSESDAGRTWDDFKDAIRRGWEDVRDAFDIEEDFAEQEPLFREHYQTQYGKLGRAYDWYEPAYRYGYLSGLDERYDAYEAWDDRLAADLQREWQGAEWAAGSTWDDVKEAVRRGWESIRDAFDDDQFDTDDKIAQPGGVGGYTSQR